MMKALSLSRPWAWLCAVGLKDIENRPWALPANFELPQRVYIHAAKSFDYGAAQIIVEILTPEQKERFFNASHTPGAIIGEATITDCVDRSDSPWFFGPHGFVLQDAVLYDKPIPYRGQLGFFEVQLPEEVRV